MKTGKTDVRIAAFGSVVLMVCALTAQGAGAADDPAGYPSKLLRMVVGFTPGGAADVQARVVAQALSESFGQQVLVDNRPGQDAIIGTNFVAKASPDG